MKVAVYLLCAMAAVLVMSLYYHLFRDHPTKSAIFIVSSSIVLVGLIFLDSHCILKYQLYIAESQMKMAERQEADRRELLLHHNEEAEEIRQVALRQNEEDRQDACRHKLEDREDVDQAKKFILL